MLLKSDIRKILKKELGGFLKPYGFKSESTETGFIRKTDEGNNQIAISIVDYHPKFLLGISVAIRINEVETIGNQFFNVMPKYRDITKTIIANAKLFTGFEEYEIVNENGLQGYIDFFKTLYIDSISDFLEANSTLQGVANTLFREHKEFGPIFDKSHFIKRIIIARLVNLEFYDLITAEYYKIFCENCPDCVEQQEEILRAIEYLKAVAPVNI